LHTTPHRILILVAHTGGGHLRAAEAIAQALRRRRADDVAVEIVDALGQYAPWPFNHLAEFYPRWIDRAARTWGWGYRLTDGSRRATAMLRLFWPLVWPRTRRLLDQHPADVIVSAHPLTNHYLVWALRRLGCATPTVTVVTDPLSVHPFWLSPGIDRYLVGSATARQKALTCGLPPQRVHVTGLPVDPRFVEGLVDKTQARRSLGWPAARPAALLIGGGEGMGRLYAAARAIDAACPGVQLAVVAGRNQRLRQQLGRTRWRIPVHVYGFADHAHTMPLLMSAADVLITKAGPATLHEAFLAGLPMILNGAVPGQEEGNVRLVVAGGAGVWAPQPAHVAALVACWLGAHNDTLARMSARSRALARPAAADAVADEIWQLARNGE